MKWVERIIANKLAVYLVALAVCLLGLFCLFLITIAPFPSLSFNQLNIQLVYPGASAATVQTQVTSKVENALRGIPNIERISANTSNGSARIELTLDSNQADDLLKTQIKILQAIASSNLPTMVPAPVISEASGQSGLVSYVLTSDKLSLFQIDNLIHAKLIPKFMGIPGATTYAGNQDPVVHIRLLPDKLAQYKINIPNLSQKLNESFQAVALGNLYLNKQAYLLGLSGDIATMQGFKQLVVGYKDPTSSTGNPIYLHDIASISFSPRSLVPTYFSSYNGHIAETIQLYTTTHSNPFQVYKTTQAYVKKIAPNLPSDLKISMIDNMAKTMHDSFTEVVITILIASMLVLLIALVFLGRLRITLVPIITIPICLLGAVIFLTCLGVTLNILTLLAMVVAVGLVVDDSIVVVENITRHLENGMNKHDAIIHGTADIAHTVIGITATLLAVYLPISFCSGPFIVLLKAFAVPLAAAVFISGIAALTVTPIMCAQLISTAPPNNYQRWFNQRLKSVIAAYQIMLKLVLRVPFISLAIIGCLIATGIYFDLKIPLAAFPSDPQGIVLVKAQSSPQDTLSTLSKKFDVLSNFYQNKYVGNYSINVNQDSESGRLSGQLLIHYKDQYLHQNKKFSDEINAYMKSNHLQSMVATMPDFLNWGNDADVTFDVYGSDTTANINKKAAMLTAVMKKSAIFSHVSNTINQPYKQLEFNINTVLAAKFGLYRSDIANLLATYYGGYQLDNYFNIDGLSVPVVMQLNKSSLRDTNSIQQLQILSPVTHNYYPLSKFVSVGMVAKPVVISSMNNEPSVEIDANLAKGYALSDAIPYVNSLMTSKEAALSYQYLGGTLRYLEGNTQTIMVAVLGIACIYFLLAILFSNLADPFIILLTVPFSVVSGALCLYLFGDSLNLFSILALITLIGLITKHGVLIVQFANHELSKGATVMDAILTATHDRFRPIIMTTLAMTLGALPLLLSQSVMYVARRDLGMVLISGLIIGTFFSLLIVPLVYTLIKKAERLSHH